MLKISAEKAIFDGQEDVHDLPPIFHYWSNKHLRPSLETFGFSNPDEFFRIKVRDALSSSKAGISTIISIGSGNCDTEIRLAKSLLEGGLRDFRIECMDINDAMFERAAAMARSAGVENHLVPLNADFNTAKLTGPYDAVIANQSLHHVVELEHLFDQIRFSMSEDGSFIVSDMIGRNGHQRWPEALEVVESIWRDLDEKYKFNNQLRRQEDKFLNWDSSGAGFEGIRAQDVLPELIRRFSFEFFYGYGNVIDIFVDRSFGPNFDPEDAADRALIDKIQAMDIEMLGDGRLTPTHMFAVMKRPSEQARTIVGNAIPIDCVHQKRSASCAQPQDFLRRAPHLT